MGCAPIHRGILLNKDAPAFRPADQFGKVKSQAILGGLHHHYVRILVSVRTGASRRGQYCHRPTPPRSCSGPWLPPDRSICAGSMAGRYLPWRQSISRLTSPHDSLLSKCRRPRHAEFESHQGRHLVRKSAIKRSASQLSTVTLSSSK